MIDIRLRFDNTCIQDIEKAVTDELEGLNLKFRKGSRIALTAGSRGIDNIASILKTAAGFVKLHGAIPFIVPAMGSHGGATAEGQAAVLHKLGIRQDVTGAPILSSMGTVTVGAIDAGPYPGGESGVRLPVHMDRNAYEADGIIVINRVKPHTSFHSEVESGLMKMMAIGLGKQVQAANIHAFGTHGLRTLILPVARTVLSTGKIIAGMGIVENAYDRSFEIRAFPPGDIETGDRQMLGKARLLMPRLPVENIDVLIVEEIGKNISGTGMDTNIIGRIRIEGEPEPAAPVIKRIAVLGLTRMTAGNAYGIGLADVTTRRLVDEIDYKSTYANVLATNFIERAKIPLIAADDDEAVEIALRSCGISDSCKARIIRIKNTLQLERMSVSESVYEDIKGKVEKC